MAGPTNRDVSVRLTLDSGDFVVNIKQVGDKVQEADQKIKRAASGWSTAFGGAKTALGGLVTQVGQVVRTAGGLAGAFSLGAAAHRAIGLREQYRDLEFQMKRAGQEGANWRDLMKDAEAAQKATGQSTAVLGQIMKQSLTDVGDPEYARASMLAVGAAAKVGGKDIGQLSAVAGTLNEKFGATAETLDDMLAAVISKTDKGGLSLGAMGDKFAALAGEAVDAGFEGSQGLGDLLGLLNTLDDRLGDRSIPAFKKLFQTMKEGSSTMRELEKSSGVKFTGDETGLEKIRKLIGSEKGRKALELKLGGDMRVIADQLAKPFDEAFAAAKEKGEGTKAATERGLAAFDASIKKMGEKGLTGAEVATEAARRSAEDPRAKLEAALDRLAASFTRPKVIGAIDKLADKMPMLADIIGDLVDFAVDHPVLAGLGAAGAVAGKGATGSVLGNVVGPAALSGLKGILWKDGPAGGKAAGDAAGEALKGKADGIGKRIAGATSGALGSGGLTTAGKLLAGVAVAGIIAELGMLGKQVIDSVVDPDVRRKAGQQETFALANAATAEGVDRDEKKTRLAAAKKELAELEKGPTGAESWFGPESMIGKAGLGLGRIGHELTGGAVGFSWDEINDTTKHRQNQIAKARKTVETLEKQTNVQPDYITNMDARSPGMKEGEKQTKINNAPEVGLALARALATTKLTVVVSNPFDFGPSRGPIGPDGKPRLDFYDLPGNR